MSWYIWGVTSFDVPLLLDQSLICMKFSRYILFCKLLLSEPMEMERFELLTPCLQGRCSPNWATPPWMRAFPLSRRSLIHLCSVFISISQSLLALPFWVMGLSGLEPPTSRLSGVRSNRLSYKPIESGIHLLSHAVSSIVPSADQVLTVVFGMGTGVSPDRIDTRILVLSVPPAVLSESSYGASLPKPFRTVRQYDLSVTQIWKSKLFQIWVTAISCRLT